MALDAQKEAEIDALRAESQETRRATVPALEALLYKPLPVLDHGFIRVIDYMGDDPGIVQAARVSYGRGTKQVSNDKALINYLMRRHHTSPFEMCEIKLHVKLPIFVARQWIRHRTANVNEYSARYSVLDREFYVPDRKFMKLMQVERQQQSNQAGLFGALDAATPEHTAQQSTTNKQGREAVLESEAAAQVLRNIKRVSESSFTAYEKLLGEDGEGGVEGFGIARELARMVLPLNTYTQWYWKIDLHNLLHFTRLRADGHAQYEIRAYADRLIEILQAWVPLTYAAFANYRKDAAVLSSNAQELLRRHLAGDTNVTFSDVGMTKREWLELVTLFPALDKTANT
ncbi:thymidylate synthase (FAD) [Arboricoccus pini]|uniref:Flavin-dependent thymidylate synthase n=1 Tax=Arboricoccus pini TaxID=1963835 RepID=A0A212QPU5_9PROT|nr:FAD-dependent thymidylate synthase [Arboricoccus pini]SNB61437.1 thymidylate synthase (FAD) [Arboricoccus pini]